VTCPSCGGKSTVYAKNGPTRRYRKCLVCDYHWSTTELQTQAYSGQDVLDEVSVTGDKKKGLLIVNVGPVVKVALACEDYHSFLTTLDSMARYLGWNDGPTR